MKDYEIQCFVQKSIEYLRSLQCSLGFCQMQRFIWKVRGMWIVKVVTESYIYSRME